MDRIQERILEIALQVPEYVGYQAKERRREADKLVRRQLAAKYEEQRVRLTRISRQAPLDYIVELENLDQKLQRLIARMNTAPGGYAGWFDAAQIGEGDLDQITQLDAALAEGVAKLGAAFDQVGRTVKARAGVEDAVGSSAELLDSLNSQFDQREQFLAMGKKPSLELPVRPSGSALDALKTKETLPDAFLALTTLKLDDAVSFRSTDYVISGKITFAVDGGSFWALRLRDGADEPWLRVGPGAEVSICVPADLDLPSPFPETLRYQDRSYTRGGTGTANVTVEGTGGAKRGSAKYARYTTDGGLRLYIEDYGTEIRAMAGETLDPGELKVYRR